MEGPVGGDGRERRPAGPIRPFAGLACIFGPDTARPGGLSKIDKDCYNGRRVTLEASRRLPDDLKASQPEIDWRAIAGIGNVLRHDYHESQPAILWQTCRKDLGPLKAAVTRIQTELEKRAPVRKDR